MFRELFLILILLDLNTIFNRKTLKLTKNYHQKLITPNGFILIRIGKNSNNRNLIKTYIAENVYLTFFYSTNLEKIIVS